MTVEKVSYTAKVRTTGSWKDIFMKHPLSRLVFVALLAAQATPSQSGPKCKRPLQFPASLEKSSHLLAAHSTFRHLQAWSTLMSSSPSQPISRYRRI